VRSQQKANKSQRAARKKPRKAKVESQEKPTSMCRGSQGKPTKANESQGSEKSETARHPARVATAPSGDVQKCSGMFIAAGEGAGVARRAAAGYDRPIEEM